MKKIYLTAIKFVAAFAAMGLLSCGGSGDDGIENGGSFSQNGNLFSKWYYLEKNSAKVSKSYRIFNADGTMITGADSNQETSRKYKVDGRNIFCIVPEFSEIVFYYINVLNETTLKLNNDTYLREGYESVSDVRLDEITNNNSNYKSQILGQWFLLEWANKYRTSTYNIEFNSDGTFARNGEIQGEYQVEGDYIYFIDSASIYPGMSNPKYRRKIMSLGANSLSLGGKDLENPAKPEVIYYRKGFLN